MAVELLVEIGTEEIPSGYLDSAMEEMRLLTRSSLGKNRIAISGELFVHSTPRRMVLFCQKIAEQQEEMFQELMGPARKAAYDQRGNPTKAAIGFAQKYGCSLDDIRIVETPKGEYLSLKRHTPGRPSVEILSNILPRVISGIPWPKSMRWGGVGFPFVRPIHWILALLGGKVIPFEMAGVRSGSRTMGHRFMSPRSLQVTDHLDYFKKMKESWVMIDPEDRRKEIEGQIIKKAKDVGAVPVQDVDLVKTVSNLVEFPYSICGRFDERFLELPEAVLITVMKRHQRYFAIQDKDGSLIPHFVAVNNTVPKDDSVVIKGHERVLRARLSDAVFFFNADRKRPLKDRLEDLRGVIYQTELGTSFAKVERFTELARYLAEQIAPEKGDSVNLAARLCKCDLVTEMVKEFPTLQGVMGREYARKDGYPEEICVAIHEHYLPAKADDGLPSSAIGAIVGLADRMDTIGGCFAIGLEPTGATDPFAVRRHALAIIRILENTGWNVSISGLISRSLEILRSRVSFDSNKAFRGLLDFFRERYKNRMSALGYANDLTEAVISADFDNIYELSVRIRHLRRFISESGDFQSLALTFKRVSNIIKGQKGPLTVDESMFKEDCERDLWKASQELEKEIRDSMEKRDYFNALNVLAKLKGPVDAFFDGVEVLKKEDPRLRDNRVAVLQHLAELFLKLADFSRFSI